VNVTTAWRTDEPCPNCGKGLTLLDDGVSPIRWECRLCGDGRAELAEGYGGEE
jgi:ribosomal protein S27AE